MRDRLAAAILTVALLLGAAPSGKSIAFPTIPVASIPTPLMANQRIHVFFTGKVQGVGFRNSVKEYALEMGLVGWVKNLEDQRVEMVAEGPEQDLNLLLGRLCSEFEVQKAEVKKEKAEGKLRGFEVVR